MKYEFHPEALFELEAATDYYAECQSGLELRNPDDRGSGQINPCFRPL